MNGYFGDYVKYKHLLFSENLDAGNSSVNGQKGCRLQYEDDNPFYRIIFDDFYGILLEESENML